MAFSGYINKAGEIVIDEIYHGRTRIDMREKLEMQTQRERPRPYIASPRTDSELIAMRAQLEASLPMQTSSSGDQISSSSSLQPYSGHNKQSESPSNSVSTRHISSNDSSSSSYMSTALLGKLRLPRNQSISYNSWYSAKQKERQQRLQRAKQEEQQRQLKAAERKRIAERCYELWCHNKDQLAAKQRVHEHLMRAAMQASCASLKLTKVPRNLTHEQIKQEVANWWLKKAQQLQLRQEARRKAELKNQKQQQHRQQLAQLAWNKWISKIADKPKPVPLNQGMDSLRGTISQLYINPHPWTPLQPEIVN